MSSTGNLPALFAPVRSGAGTTQARFLISWEPPLASVPPKGVNIDRGIWIEDLVRERPASVGFLREKGIRCLACGEPIWGTLEDAARDKGFTDEEIDKLVSELNALSGARARCLPS